MHICLCTYTYIYFYLHTHAVGLFEATHPSLRAFLPERPIFAGLLFTLETPQLAEATENRLRLVGSRKYQVSFYRYGVATISRLFQIVGLFCKRAL